MKNLFAIIVTILSITTISCTKEYDHTQCNIFNEERIAIEDMYLNRVISKYEYDERLENLQETIDEYNYTLSDSDDFNCSLTY